VKLRWLGTAGFELRLGEAVVLIDPYFSRGNKARPALPVGREEIRRANYIFLTHTHFDHALDVPFLARRTGAQIFTSRAGCRVLQGKGAPPGQLYPLQGGEELDLEGFTLRVIPSHHVRFDLPLVVRTLGRVGRTLPGLLRLAQEWPMGQVLAYLIQADGFGICHFGSAGHRGPVGFQHPDLALIPLQGHSRIHEIAARLVALLQPRLVIPHHWDDFYPPFSQLVPVEPFIEAVARLSPQTEVRVLALGEWFQI